ncbi:MAG TPA: UvrD-helicase domain-containing protein [Planctomycetota bacterium]|nr:UvrD-helicase domain-containing protein [Planctomycetota bacterium]
MSARPLTDQHDRDRACTELGTSFAVEAAAGAGKTSVLVTRVLNLVRTGKAPLDRIVAVTFTEKAAGELKMRVREETEKALVSHLHLAHSRHVRNEDVTPLAAPERERFRKALEDLGHAPIGTIHGFCAGLLRERPVEAGVDPQFAVADELTASLLRDRAWSDWLEAELAAGSSALLRAVAQGVGLDGWGNHVFGLAERLLDCRDLLDGRPRRPAALPDLRALQVELLAGLDALLWHAQSHASGPQAEKFLGDLEAARRRLALSQLLSAASAEAAIAGLHLPGRPLGKGHWDSKAAYEEGKAAHARLRARLGEAQAAFGHDLAAAVGEALVGFLDVYRAAKDAEGLLDFQDLLLLTRNLLRDAPPGGAREHFKHRFDFLLIDEFQDTDPLQVEIAFFLAERRDRHAPTWEQVEVEPGKLFLVGDPKQSIYRFRRADIEVYERAKDALRRQGELLALSQSFRPVPGVAAAVNAIFAPCIRKPDDGLYQPEYVALDPYRLAVGSRPAVVLLPPPSALAEEFESQDAARRLEARCVAAMIHRIVEEERWEIEDPSKDAMPRNRPVAYRDIAVLARTYASTDHYADAFAAADIPLRIVGGRRFYTTHEVHALLAVLQAIDNPHDRVALVAALRGPFFGASDDELMLAAHARGPLSYLDAAHAGTVGNAMAVLREFHQRRNDEGLALFLQRLFERTKALELFSLRPLGEQRVANLLKIADQARALEATQRVSFRGFVRWLSRLQETEARETESPSAEAGDNFVQLLSIHGAKGLEFPVVFVADMTSAERHAARFIVLRDHPASEGRFAFYLGTKRDCVRTANWPGDDYEERRAKAESARLFYVAATRARDLLFLLPGWGKKSEEGFSRFLGPSLPGALAYDTGTLDLAGAPPRAFRIPPPGDAPSPAVRRRLADRERWREGIAATIATANRGMPATTPSRLEEGLAPASDAGSHLHLAHGGNVRNGDVTPAGAGSDLGRRLGSAVHQCLRRATLEDRAAVLARLRAEAVKLDLTPDQVQDAARLLDVALASPLLRRARAASACYHEVPFAVEVGGTLLTGAMDLLFVEGDQVVVVDFKTDAARDEHEIARRAAAYTPQAAAYALAVSHLHLALGGPVRNEDATPRTLCKPVREVVLFFLSQGREWRIPVTDLLLRQAAQRVSSISNE